ncbi:MAG: NAD(P)-dependent oxidoreductase [bacterium]|nr:NAD(P)-dependent oxidoreductase [bacterium]
MGENLGFIGLGKMGTPLTRNLMADGHKVSGYDVDPARMKMLEEAGGHPASSAKEVAGRADVVFTMLLKPGHIEENTIGPKGIAAAGKKGLILIEMSTMNPNWSRGLAEKLAGRGITMLDAPVSGTVPHVESRTLAYMVGGEKAAYERILPIISPLAKSVIHTGGNGTGCSMKLVTNLIVNAGVALLAEGLLLGERSGLSAETIMSCLRSGAAASHVLELKGEKILGRDFTPHASVGIYVKDLGLCVELAEEMGFDVPMTAAGLGMFQRSEAAGWKEDDCARVIEAYEGKDR